jgi:hypothetical protein
MRAWLSYVVGNEVIVDIKAALRFDLGCLYGSRTFGSYPAFDTAAC